MFCKKCGKQLGEDCSFCENCGTQVEKLNTEETVWHQKNHSKKDIKQVLIALSIVGILTLITIMVGNTLERKDKTTNALSHKVDESAMVDTIDDAKNEVEQADAYWMKLVASKDTYDHLYDTYIANDEQAGELRYLLEKLNKTIEARELEVAEETLASLESLKIKMKDESKKQTSILKNKLENMSTPGVYRGELDIIKGYQVAINKLLVEENYVKAMSKLREWDAFLNMIMRGSDYIIKVSQVDVSEYPKIKIYLSLQSQSTNQTLDNLELQYFYLSEKPEGDAGYIKKQINKAVQLNEVEGVNISMVADVSGSMQGEPLFFAKNIIKDFISSIQFNIGDKVSLISFADHVHSDIPFTSDDREVMRAVNSMQIGDRTALYDALYVAINQTAIQSGAKCIIAFTDGQDNASLCTPQIVAELAMRYNIPLFIIGVGAGMDTDNLQYIADHTGGFYRNINSINSMQDIYLAIYRQQKELYLLEYETTTAKDMIVQRNIYINYLNHDIGARSEYAYIPAILMEGIKSSAQLFVNDFIIYDSDKRYLTAADLKLLTEEQLRLARNEIYARRGRMFVDAKLQEYFDRRAWYKPTTQPNDFKESLFNDYERANAYFIRDYENLQGFN
ncbi:YARHG domain-containing protein [Cellulosilyticum sp. I15G10I2]|uniref:YARHG domain-containing protein n=1 Tax=Cellulosilyticum sp. I15G10I2 TaxID=1892843 RepID=UPI00085CBD5C|nr:YARHG domain-containing protein [Cellulosilyticum sp. I15G10I2]